MRFVYLLKQAASANGAPLAQSIDKEVCENNTDQTPIGAKLTRSFTQSTAEITLLQGAYLGSSFSKTLPYRVQDPRARAVFGSTLQLNVLTGESQQVQTAKNTTSCEHTFTAGPGDKVEAEIKTQYKEYSRAFELITTLKGPVTAVCHHPHTGNKIFYQADIYETLKKRRAEVTEDGAVTLDDDDMSISIHTKGSVHYRIGADHHVDLHPYSKPQKKGGQ